MLRRALANHAYFLRQCFGLDPGRWIGDQATSVQQVVRCRLLTHVLPCAVRSCPGFTHAWTAVQAMVGNAYAPHNGQYGSSASSHSWYRLCVQNPPWAMPDTTLRCCAVQPSPWRVANREATGSTDGLGASDTYSSVAVHLAHIAASLSTRAMALRRSVYNDRDEQFTRAGYKGSILDGGFNEVEGGCHW